MFALYATSLLCSGNFWYAQIVAIRLHKRKIFRNAYMTARSTAEIAAKKLPVPYRRHWLKRANSSFRLVSLMQSVDRMQKQKEVKKVTEDIKETLKKQLQLLSERSKEPGSDLPALTHAMVELASKIDPDVTHF